MGVAKEGITDERKQNFFHRPTKDHFFLLVQPLGCCITHVHQRSENNRFCGSTYSTYKLTFKIRGENSHDNNISKSCKYSSGAMLYLFSVANKGQVQTFHFSFSWGDCFNCHSSHQCKTSLHSGNFPSFNFRFQIVRYINNDVGVGITSLLKDS